METQECGATLIQLEPFNHQVGGHYRVFQLADGTIGKPLIFREQSFYMTMPRSLLDFTPQYRGVINIAWKANGTGGMSPVVRRSRGLDEDVSSSLDDITRPAEELSNDGLETSGLDKQKSTYFARFTPSRDQAAFEKNSAMRTDISPSKFLLLANLVFDFRKPCILDLKMGIRLSGDDESGTKKLLHTKLASETTSISLGFRLSGMKVYKASTGEYVAHDKYHGRRLDCDGVSRTLRYFLHDGRRTLTDVIDQMLDRLRRLEKAVEQLDSYRFYGSSLLIAYDGTVTDCSDDCQSVLSSQRQVAVSMIDFGHATKSGFYGDTIVHVGPHRGYLFGLRNLIRILEELLCNADTSVCSDADERV